MQHSGSSFLLRFQSTFTARENLIIVVIGNTPTNKQVFSLGYFRRLHLSPCIDIKLLVAVAVFNLMLIRSSSWDFSQWLAMSLTLMTYKDCSLCNLKTYWWFDTFIVR
ncbi:unnamed protein product [Haemonchus placei]|uniref:7TM_GPCR_Srx domain-containing protein n=1 Tax=Haemonchus placei TaxID=6290 RepID=A0A0N4W9T8_HAEPC|nr:unnamed protein product [Haemonchus placei]